MTKIKSSNMGTWTLAVLLTGMTAGCVIITDDVSNAEEGSTTTGTAASTGENSTTTAGNTSPSTTGATDSSGTEGVDSSGAESVDSTGPAVSGTSGSTTDESTGTEGSTGSTTDGGTGSTTDGGTDSTTDGDTDSTTDGGTGTESTTGNPALSFAVDIYPIISANCGCHNGAPGGLSMPNANTAYNNLVNVGSTQSALDRIEPGDPDASYFWHKINNTHQGVGGVGNVMPPGGSLSAPAIALIEDWILDGAAP